MDEIDFCRLLDWVEGKLTPDEAAEIQQRFDAVDADAQGSSARDAVDWIRAFHERRRALAFPDPPTHLRSRLESLFNGRRRDDADSFLAELTNNDRTLAGAGVRGLDLDETAQLVFLSAGFDVVLDVEPVGPSVVAIRGQVLPDRGTGVGHEVSVTGGTPVDTDEHGAFFLDDVPTSVTSIRITSSAATLEVPIDLERLE